MKLLLVCNTAIIEHIFVLVCKRLKIELTVQNTSNVSSKYDFIILDQPFIDNKFSKIKKFSYRIGAISAEELPFDKPRDFLIPRPFLPTKLEAILKEQIELLKEDKKENKNFSNFIPSEEDIVVPVIDFINDSLDDSEEFDIIEIEDEYNNEDESIVSLSALQMGGVLDNSELNKINTILKEETSNNFQDSDWKDISEIIDEALDEVKEYEFDLNEEKYHLILNRFKVEELKPLLTKLNQQLIDKLSKGETVDIKISLKDV